MEPSWHVFGPEPARFGPVPGQEPKAFALRTYVALLVLLLSYNEPRKKLNENSWLMPFPCPLVGCCNEQALTTSESFNNLLKHQSIDSSS